jgi:hypothetical protein
MKCRGRDNGWPFCGWVMTGTLVKPIYFFEKKLQQEGSTQAPTVGKDLSRAMALLDKLFVTVKKEDGENVIPGYEAWLSQASQKWSPDDCFCTENMKMPPFRKGERELLTTLWLKSMVLHNIK